MYPPRFANARLELSYVSTSVSLIIALSHIYQALTGYPHHLDPCISIAGVTVCHTCLRRGPPCLGPAGLGCKHPRMKNGTRYTRRQMINNSSMCSLCHPARCSVSGCNSAVHSSSWASRLCRRHASAARPTALARSSLAPSHLKFARCNISRKTAMLSSKCHIRWCTSVATSNKMHRGKNIALCSAHRRWFGTQRSSSLQCIRHGVNAARCSLEEYEFGHMRATALSDDGCFQHACTYCSALYFDCEANGSSRQFNACCKGGSLRFLPRLPPAAAFVAQLLTGYVAEPHQLSDHPHTLASILTTERLSGKAKRSPEHFQQHIRRYNAAMSFASFSDMLGSAEDFSASDAKQSSPRPPVYILHGRAYHIAGTLYPSTDNRPSYCQLYVMDPTDATDARVESFAGLNSEILRSFHDFLTEPILHKDPWTGSCFCFVLIRLLESAETLCPLSSIYWPRDRNKP